MKFLLNLSIAVVSLLSLLACSDDTHYTFPYFHRNDNIERITNSLAGRHDGSVYVLAMKDGKEVDRIPDSIWTKWGTNESGKHRPILRFAVGGYGNQNIVIQQFPISIVGYIVHDDSLAVALKKVPVYDISLPYSIDGRNNKKNPESHEGQVIIGGQDINLTLNYGGQQHLVTMKFSSPWALYINADSIQPIRHVQLQLSDILIDGTSYGNIDDWNEALFVDIKAKGDYNERGFQHD